MSRIVSSFIWQHKLGLDQQREIEVHLEGSIKLLKFFRENEKLINRKDKKVIQQFKEEIQECCDKQYKLEMESLLGRSEYRYSELCKFRREVLRSMGMTDREEAALYKKLKEYMSPQEVERVGRDVVSKGLLDPNIFEEMFLAMELAKDNPELYQATEPERKNLKEVRDVFFQ